MRPRSSLSPVMGDGTGSIGVARGFPNVVVFVLNGISTGSLTS